MMEYEFFLTKNWVSSQQLRNAWASRLSLPSPLPVCVICDEHSLPMQASHSFQTTVSHVRRQYFFFLLNYPWPPFGSRWIQTSQTSILGCWYVFSFSCIWHSTKQKWERLPLIKSFLFFFLSKFPFNCDQEENSNFIPRITENLAGGQQFLSHSTVTAPHSSQPVSQENYKLSVYWSMLEVKSCSSWWALLHEKFGQGQSWLAACAPPPPGSGCSFLHPSPLCCSIQPRLWRLRQRAKDDRIRPCTYKSQSLQKSDCLIIFTSRLWRGKSPTVTNQRESNQSPPGLFVLWHKIIE